MAEIGNHAGNEPWPSLEWAGWIFDRASFVLVGSLVLGAAATIAIVWMGIVKEHHWDLARERANERIAELNSETEKLRSKNIQLQRSIQPRRIAMGGVDGDNDIRSGRFAEVAKHPATAFLVSVPDFESNILEADIAFALKKSGWTVVRRPDAVPAGMILPGVHIITLQDPILYLDNPTRIEFPPETAATRSAASVWKLLLLDLGPPNGPGLGVLPEREYRGSEFRLRGSPVTLDDNSILICIGMKPVPAPDVPAEPPLQVQ